MSLDKELQKKLWYQKYKTGILASIAAGIMLIGSGFAIKECNDNLGNAQKNRIGMRRDVIIKKKLGVILDTSISRNNKERIRLALHDVRKTYGEKFKIRYSLDIRLKDINNDVNSHEGYLPFIPDSWRNDRYTLVLTDNHVKNFKSKRVIGKCDGRYNLIVIHNITKHNYASLYNIFAHELGHSNGVWKHHLDENCIMYKENGENKRFCKKSIETILNNK